ncbi:MAG: PepSY-like domain-containing protein [Polyangia bacterium]
MKRTAISLFVVIALAAPVHASDKPIEASAVPKPVIAKVHTKYPAAKILGYELETEDGQTSYEVKIADGARQLEVLCSADGAIVAEEEKIAIADVPARVRDALKNSPKFGSWTVRGAERIVSHEQTSTPVYELKIASGSKRAELTFSPEGTLTKTE